MKTRIWICVVLTVALAACAHTGSKAPTSFNVAMPEGWRSIDTDEPMIFMTKDGGYKQFIMVRERPLTDPFVFTQRSMYAGMLPEQAAELVVNEVIADTNISNFSLLENSPARIAGHNGFRLTFLYSDAAGFVFKTIYYGFIKGQYVLQRPVRRHRGPHQGELFPAGPEDVPAGVREFQPGRRPRPTEIPRPAPERRAPCPAPSFRGP